MKKIFLAILMIASFAFLAFWGTEMGQKTNGVADNPVSLDNPKPKTKIQNADIIFQASKSGQSKAIQLATGSKYSHMGVLSK